MKVIYDDVCECITVADGGNCPTFAIYYNGDIRLNISKDIPLTIATKLFQRWHQIDQSAEPEVIARALDDALNFELHVVVSFNGYKTQCPIYVAGVFNEVTLQLLIRKIKPNECQVKPPNFNVKHNITEDRVDYFIDGKLKGWLPVVRKEIGDG